MSYSYPTRSKSRKSMTLVEFLVILTIGIILLAIVSGGIFGLFKFRGIEYSDGQRTGQVYKISRKGMLWRTWEGELSLNLTRRDSKGALVNQIFNFSIEDEAVARQVEQAAATDKTVTLHYKQYLFRGACYGSTAYNVTAVSPAQP